MEVKKMKNYLESVVHKIKEEGNLNKFEYKNYKCVVVRHPQLWDYAINKLGLKEPLDWLGVDYK
jgi:hypothetical protein